MAIEPEVVRGLLGWSNMRPGLEFYRWDEKSIPRFTARHGGSKWGDLLVDEIGQGRIVEGCSVVVAILPHSWADTEIRAVEDAVREAVGV